MLEEIKQKAVDNGYEVMLFNNEHPIMGYVVKRTVDGKVSYTGTTPGWADEQIDGIIHVPIHDTFTGELAEEHAYGRIAWELRKK